MTPPGAAPREVGLLGASSRGPRAVPALPPELGTPPEPGAPPAAQLEWLTAAAAVLDGRVRDDAAELDRLAAEWGHVIRNLERLRPEEITAVAEGQARIREAIAAGRALVGLVELQRRHLEALVEAPAPGPPPPPVPPVAGEAVARLLEAAVDERARIAGEMLELTGEALTGAVLDLEVVRRESLREPERAAVGLFEVGRRLTAVAEGIRRQAGAADLRPRDGESLPAALRRAGETLGPWVRSTLAWSGPEAVEPRAAVAMAAVAEECLRHLATVPGSQVEMRVTAAAGGAAVLRLSTPGGGLLPDEGRTWLVRARARAALAGGRLECAADGTVVELHL